MFSCFANGDHNLVAWTGCANSQTWLIKFCSFCYQVQQWKDVLHWVWLTVYAVTMAHGWVILNVQSAFNESRQFSVFKRVQQCAPVPNCLWARKIGLVNQSTLFAQCPAFASTSQQILFPDPCI